VRYFSGHAAEECGVVQAVDKISKAETTKQQSRQLRGHLARDLADTATPFDGEGYSLLKFHGIYQGYDRDTATELKQAGNSKHYQLMLRVRIPGGRLTAEQYLALDAIGGKYATTHCGSPRGSRSSFTASSSPGSRRRWARSMPG
jgi:sulfite reductase (ferredoxin)